VTVPEEVMTSGSYLPRLVISYEGQKNTHEVAEGNGPDVTVLGGGAVKVIVGCGLSAL
jgi:hypothetical protein